jgi:pentatricopeptide repeat protein
MEDEGVRRDSFTYSSAIGVCGAAGRWNEAVDLIGKMKRDGARPNRVAFTSAITACAGSRYAPPFAPYIFLVLFLLFSSIKNTSHNYSI